MCFSLISILYSFLAIHAIVVIPSICINIALLYPVWHFITTCSYLKEKVHAMNEFILKTTSVAKWTTFAKNTILRQKGKIFLTYFNPRIKYISTKILNTHHNKNVIIHRKLSNQCREHVEVFKMFNFDFETFSWN